MLRALQLAKNGIGTTRPNPSVGAVVVHNNTIIGEGFTSPYGGFHAEVNAINAVKNTELLKKATIYVTLEPCSHHGKTPPCTSLIIQKKIPKVVIGCTDPNHLVAGKGIALLKEEGCEVLVGVLEEACKKHHKRFLTFQNNKRPYIILKWAETKNGFIAPHSKNEQKPVWISNVFSRQLVHKWRAEEHAILIGTNTVISDNPTLNVRNWYGNNPIRVVLDKNLRIPENVAVLDRSIKTIVISNIQHKKEYSNIGTDTQLVYGYIDFSKNIAQQICDVLYKKNIQSIIIEGGTKTLQTFINENLWDEARVFTGNSKFKKGVKKPVFSGIVAKEIKIKDDLLRIYTRF